MKQNMTELREDIGKSLIITGNFKYPFSIIAITSRQKASKDGEDLSNTINQLVLLDIYT